MNKQGLIGLLEDIAKHDLTEGAELRNHPCSIAVDAIKEAFDDIEFLKRIISGSANIRSKRAAMLIGLPYDPHW